MTTTKLIFRACWRPARQLAIGMRNTRWHVRVNPVVSESTGETAPLLSPTQHMKVMMITETQCRPPSSHAGHGASFPQRSVHREDRGPKIRIDVHVCTIPVRIIYLYLDELGQTGVNLVAEI